MISIRSRVRLLKASINKPLTNALVLVALYTDANELILDVLAADTTGAKDADLAYNFIINKTTFLPINKS